MDGVKQSTDKEEVREQQQPIRHYSSPSKRKTRDLPDLCNCHGCKYHVSNVGRDKLHILTSEWRIVLLCNRCSVLVKSAKICSYCFLQTTNESFRCLHCARMIHKDCVLQFRCFAPWSYSSPSGVDFSICVDCWIPPKLLSNSRKSPTTILATKIYGNIKISDSSFLARRKSIPRVSRHSEDAAIDANCVGKQKIADDSRASCKGLEKAEVARRALEFAANSCDANYSDLSFRLHQTLNSSAKIFSVSSNCLPDKRFITNSDSGRASTTNERFQCSDNHADKNETTPLNEEEGSCSDKMVNVSNGFDINSMESGAYSFRTDNIGVKDELCTCDIRCGCEFKLPEDHSTTGKPEIRHDRFSKVYCRRRRHVQKISLRHTSRFIKSDLPHPAMFIYRRFGSKTQISAPKAPSDSSHIKAPASAILSHVHHQSGQK